MASGATRSYAGPVLVVAGLWSSGLVVAALLAPAYSSGSTSASGTVVTGSATLVQENGVKVLVPVGLPLVAVAAVGLVLRRRRRRSRPGAGPFAWALTAVVGAVSVLGMLTIGIFILPVVVLLAVSCALASAASPIGVRPG